MTKALSPSLARDRYSGMRCVTQVVGTTRDERWHCHPHGTDWLLVSEPGKTGADVTFGHFWVEMTAFNEIKPEK